MSRLALAALATAAFLCACAPMPPAAPARSSEPAALRRQPAAGASDWVLPNDKLVVQGIPPIPASVAEEVARYADFRGHGFVDWHPTRREMLVGHRKAGGNTTQIYRLASPMGELEPLTDFAEPVRQASYEPLTGDSHRLRAQHRRRRGRADLPPRPRDPAGERSSPSPTCGTASQGWLHLSSRLLYLSVPLDRTAAGGTARPRSCRP